VVKFFAHFPLPWTPITTNISRISVTVLTYKICTHVHALSSYRMKPEDIDFLRTACYYFTLNKNYLNKFALFKDLF